MNGVKPGIISVPAKPAKATAPKANGVAMPSSQINPFVPGGKQSPMVRGKR